MNILIVAATSAEIQSTIDFLKLNNFKTRKNEFRLLITGVGQMAATYFLTRSLQATRPDYVIQAGIAGSFHSELPPGSVVYVEEELTGDMGAEEGHEFRDLFDLGLVEENQFPFRGKSLINPYIENKFNYGLRSVRSIGINEITTRKERIDLIRQKYSPDIESMEGAAFHYVCLQEKIHFLQIRAVSNYVGERNKLNWRLQSAVENLNKRIIDIAGSV